MNIEKGVKIKGYSDYLIFPEEGKIWSLKRNKFIGHQDLDGYWRVILTNDDGEKWVTSVQRVIWTSVYGQIPDGMEVNHISENKDENFISNLELVTHKENINFGTRTERTCKQVERCDLQGNVLEIYPSLKEAGRQGYNKGNISQCCNNCYLREGNNSYKGYTWRYIS